jgi:anti-sigma B factor antagonist
MPTFAGFSVEMMSGIPVVTAPSVIDVDNATMLDGAIRSAAQGHSTVVVDLGRTIICLSAGVHVLTRWRQQLATKDGELRLVIRTASLLRFFTVFGVDQMFPIFGTLADAVDEQPAVVIPPQRSGHLADAPAHPAS